MRVLTSSRQYLRTGAKAASAKTRRALGDLRESNVRARLCALVAAGDERTEVNFPQLRTASGGICSEKGRFIAWPQTR